MEKGLIEAAIRRRQPLPDAIAGAPQMLWGLEAYYDAFVELSTDRQIGGPIPWSSIDRYACRHGIEGESFEYLLRMVRALDDTFLAHCRSESEKGKDHGGHAGVQTED